MHKDILVIDDNPDIRFLICNILKEQNFNAVTPAIKKMILSLESQYGVV